MSNRTLASVVANYGQSAKGKLSNPAIQGEPEDQLRTPLHDLFKDLAELCGFKRDQVEPVGETSLASLKTRPDYAITVRQALVGFVEVKQPGKGADPRSYKGHDKEQWLRLQSLPNLLYTDGNAFSLWRNGEIQGQVVVLNGDIAAAGKSLSAPQDLVVLFDSFLRWEPIPPRTVPELARTTARLCRLLRDEVTEQLEAGSEALTGLAKDWRLLLFPEANNEQFADGYAQAVTFGLLMARARGITLGSDLDRVGRELSKSQSLIGAALKVLTDDASNEKALNTSINTLTRVLDVVNWHAISKGKPDAWLYFYEDFLEVYDNALRKQTGSYYTPPEVVGPMVRLVDEVVREHFGQQAGLAAPAVTLNDPAAGTGTYILQILRHIAANVAAEQGEGAVGPAIKAAIDRLTAFEMQLGPFAVAQLRIHAELIDLMGDVPHQPMPMYVADTLSNPWHDSGYAPQIVAAIAEQRKLANELKRKRRINVVVGNPPYKEKAMGRGGWVEDVLQAGGLTPTAEDITRTKTRAILEDWIPPKDWGAGAHAKHLRNLYIYFWRWATWKVFEQGEQGSTGNAGVVCFITVAGFLSGPGFQKMRDWLRRTADHIWVVNCSPEGHQPEVATRIFQGVQQPVCIVMVSRARAKQQDEPAKVRYVALPEGRRDQKFEALAGLTIDGLGWQDCPTEWRAPFLPASTGDWTTYPALDELFAYNGSGTQAKRTWVIAPDDSSLCSRWDAMIAEPNLDKKEELFHPTLRKGVPADRHIRSVVREPIPGFSPTLTTVADETGICIRPVRYAFRSFDRQWIIPDSRVITQPNAEIWQSCSASQLFATAPHDRAPTAGPALTITASPPDLHHYNGRGGRVLPLWRDATAASANMTPRLIERIRRTHGDSCTCEDLFAYIAAVAAHPGYTARFAENLVIPGLRIPLTADQALWKQAVDLGRQVIWLHTFGDRCADKAAGRPAVSPRPPQADLAKIPKGGSIPTDPENMPDEMKYNAGSRTLHVGKGRIENVPPAVWEYEVSGKRVLTQWFSYRKKTRTKPQMGDKRPPSKLSEIQPDGWLAEYTTELLNVIHVLGLLVQLEPQQKTLLNAICDGPLISRADLEAAGALECPPKWKKAMRAAAATLFDEKDDESAGDEEAP
jgi:hypothetical protein